MALDKSDFSSNESIDEIEIGDATVDIIGYVIKSSNNVQSSKSSKFHKMTISNGSGREIQVIAWNEFTRIINHVQLGTIVLLSSTKASPIKNASFNSGNVNFELIIKENSTVETFGTYKIQLDNYAAEEVGIMDAYDMINKCIKVQGIIRTEPRKHKNRDYDCIVGSVTDCQYVMEVKFDCDLSDLQLLMGTSVELQGTVEKLSSGPPTLKVEDPENIKIIGNSRVRFVEVLQGYRYK